MKSIALICIWRIFN